VYLDAIWVETTYRQKSENVPVFPENVRAELAELRLQLQRQEVVQSLLAESGRLPW
jgi:hypothetical protein